MMGRWITAPATVDAGSAGMLAQQAGCADASCLLAGELRAVFTIPLPKEPANKVGVWQAALFCSHCCVVGVRRRHLDYLAVTPGPQLPYKQRSVHFKRYPASTWPASFLPLSQVASAPVDYIYAIGEMLPGGKPAPGLGSHASELGAGQRGRGCAL